MLTLEGVDAFYGDLQALHGVSLEVRAGELMALVGANAAGKTTTLRVISGTLPARGGRVLFDGQDLAAMPAHLRVAQGIVQVPEGRRLFPFMTVHENLLLGAHAAQARAQQEASLDYVLRLFPVLKDRATQLAGSLSGGEQQMCAIGRALMARPRLLMLDEPTLGIAPVLVQRIFETVAGDQPRRGDHPAGGAERAPRPRARPPRGRARERTRGPGRPRARAAGRRPAEEGLSRDVTWEPMRIDRNRLAESMEALGRIGATARGGLHRVALTDDDRRGRDLLVRWMREAGLAVTVDQMGNIFGLRAGTEARPPVFMGSHADSVPSGGRYDGQLGVLCALETLRDAQRPAGRARRIRSA